ncbi:MAG: TCR/Tet family MFS transporter [Fimbriimonas sp.]
MRREGRSPGLAFIFITILIDVIGFGLVIPVLPNLVKGLAGGTEEHQVRTYGILLACYGLMQFLFAPILGNLSDRYGRRPVLLLSLLFTGLDYVLQAVAPSIGWLFAGRIIAGITGASFTAATAYIADISPPEKRAQNFGMIGAAFGVGFILGPALGGLVGGLGPRVPFIAAAVATGLNFLYGWLVLPESLSEDNRRPFTLASANPLSAFRILATHKWVLGLAGATLALWIAQQVPPSIWVLFTVYRFKWVEWQNGLSLALIGVCSMVVQMWLIRVLSKKMSDLKMLAFSMAMNVVGFVLLGSSPTGAFMLASMVVWSVSFVGGPALQSLVSRQYGPDEQGAIQGALTSLQSLSSVIGPPLFTWVFAYFTTGPSPVEVPGASFYLGALLTVVAAGLVWLALRNRPPEAVVVDGPAPEAPMPMH